MMLLLLLLHGGLSVILLHRRWTAFLHRVLRQQRLLKMLPEVSYGLQELLLLGGHLSMCRLRPLRHFLLRPRQHRKREPVLGWPQLSLPIGTRGLHLWRHGHRHLRWWMLKISVLSKRHSRLEVVVECVCIHRRRGEEGPS